MTRSSSSAPSRHRRGSSGPSSAASCAGRPDHAIACVSSLVVRRGGLGDRLLVGGRLDLGEDPVVRGVRAPEVVVGRRHRLGEHVDGRAGVRRLVHPGDPGQPAVDPQRGGRLGVPGARVVAGGHLHDHPGHPAHRALDPGRGVGTLELDARRRRRSAGPGPHRAPRSGSSPSLLADQHEAGQAAQAAGDQRVERLVEAGAVVHQLPQGGAPGPSRSAAGARWRGRRRCRTSRRAGRTGGCAARRSCRAARRRVRGGPARRSRGRPRPRRRPWRCRARRPPRRRPPARSAASRGSATRPRISAICGVVDHPGHAVGAEQQPLRRRRPAAGSSRRRRVRPAERPGDDVPLRVHGGLRGGDRARRRPAPAPGCGRR